MDDRRKRTPTVTTLDRPCRRALADFAGRSVRFRPLRPDAWGLRAVALRFSRIALGAAFFVPFGVSLVPI